MCVCLHTFFLINGCLNLINNINGTMILPKFGFMYKKKKKLFNGLFCGLGYIYNELSNFFFLVRTRTKRQNP